MPSGIYDGRGPSSEVLEKIRLAVEDGWPMAEIIETYHVSFRMIKKHHPDYRGVIGYRKLQQEFGASWGKGVEAA